MRLVTGSATDVGRVREGNEDGLLVDETMGLVAVADGMGGHQAGEVASATALEALRAAVRSGRPIRDAIVEANEAVYDKAEDNSELRGMGTTITAGTLASGGTLLIAHVGDSRAYLLRDSDLSQITDDHSLVEEMVRDGQLTPEQAAVHPQRSIITRALGIDAEVEVALYPVELRPGDRLMLCSDGLTTMVSADDIAAILRRESDPQRAARQLIDAANEAGGEDNVTAVVVDALDEPSPAVAAAAAERDEPAAEPVVADSDTADEEPVVRRSRGRRLARLLLWFLPIVLVAAVAFGALGWYARRTFYVGFDRDRVTVYRGVSGGFLGWDPTIDHRTSLHSKDLTQAQRAAVRDTKQFGSKAAANAYVARLVRDHTRREPPTTTTTTPTTIAGVPPPAAPVQ
ncbi:MAG TPA: Stp1/IreP family PP2C-type Ser/Thr phosphatase [Acidimicrobiia bacterium]|nr:Stp1/IreP family PP2C-type Ser/Thr phosphatase [Acidimicrobiia bacterium]